MSQARKGRSLEPKAAALVSEKLKGVPKSKEHKENIAAAMRKRHAAIRVLNAVELVYESSSSESSQDAAVPAMHRRQINSAKKQASSQVLGEFKAELREYRALQDEISPWNEAFVDRHGRKPTMADVERTGIEWLVTRYKRYVLLRERLFTQTTLLRRKLDHVNPASEGKMNATRGSPSSQKTNANGPTIGELSANASRLHAAAQYKFEKSLQSSTKQTLSGHHEEKLAQSMPSSSTSSSSPRVREALNAAFEYRKNKAFETKSAALAAAAAAAASSKPVKN